MKFLTVDWLLIERLSGLDKFLQESELAEIRDDARFTSIYGELLEMYVNGESRDYIYRNPTDDVEKLNDFVESSIDEAELAERKEFAQKFLFLNRDRLRKGDYYDFDRQTAVRQFEEHYKKILYLAENLPDYIKDEIADLRMLALGYASEKVMQLLKPFCEDQKEVSESLVKRAEIETARAEEYLSEKIDVSDFSDDFIFSMKSDDGGIVIEFGDDYRILVKDGKILEGEYQDIYRWNANIPDSGRSRVLAAELSREEDKCVLQFLIENTDKYDASTDWYLTIECTDIVELN